MRWAWRARRWGDAQRARREYELACIGDNEPAGAQYYYDQPADMILYKGLASARLGEHEMAQTCFDKLQQYGQAHIDDVVKERLLCGIAAGFPDI